MGVLILIAFKFSLIGNQFVLEAGIVVIIKYEVL